MADSLAHELPSFVASDWVDQTVSTNTTLLALARQQGVQAGWPRLLGAHHQTQGKGRLGRTWHDLPGQALMFSCGFALPVAAETGTNLQGLGPAIGLRSGLALRQLLLESSRQKLTVKWPNDLMLDHGKCAGVLIEIATKAKAKATTKTTFVIIGMGINLTGHHALEDGLNRPVSDIGSHLQPHVTASDITSTLAQVWHDTLSTISTEGFTPYRSLYRNIDYLAGQAVNVVDQGEVIASGTVCGLGPDGALELQTTNGVRSFHAGDVSIKIPTKMGQP